jgi:Tol biopolymer transport system component
VRLARTRLSLGLLAIAAALILGVVMLLRSDGKARVLPEESTLAGELIDLDADGPVALTPGLYVLDVTSGGVWRVLEQKGFDIGEGPSYQWSRDGEWLVSNSIGNYEQIIAVSRDGRQRRDAKGQAWSVLRLDDGDFALHMRPGTLQEDQQEILGRFNLQSMASDQIIMTTDPAAVSPDGAYVAQLGEGEQLDLFELKSGKRTTLLSRTDDPLGWQTGGESPWSPDSKQLTVMDYSDEAALLVTGLDAGKEPVKVANNAIGSAWSPDSRSLAYVTYEYTDEDERDPEFRIEVRRADASQPARHVTLGTRPAWSPDGESLAFVRDGEIWRIGVGGSGEERLVASPLPLLDEPRWSPGGRYLAFRAVSGGGDIFAIDADGGKERLIGLGSDPVWSPDGNRIGFMAGAAFLGFRGSMATMNPDGSSIVMLGDVLYSDALSPCLGDKYEWSPDSGSIAYWSDAAGGLYVVAADGSTPARSLGEGLAPSWSPDGGRLAYSASSRPFCALFVVDTAGGTPEKLADMAVGPAWSPDGRWIAYEPVAGFGASPELMLLSPADPAQRRSLGPGSRPQWSKDSQLIAYYRPRNVPVSGPRVPAPGESREGLIVVQPISEGAAPVVEVPVSGFAGAFALSPDGRRLAYSVSDQGDFAIYVVDLADPANAQLLTTGMSPSWSPDGKTIVFGRYYTN